MTFGSLFAGVGGMDLGLERAGMRCMWQVEIDEYCRRVLAKHWPDLARHEDVRDVGRDELAPVDVVAGGVPCQPTSQAAARTERGAGWLWPEYARIVSELRPRYAVLENPEALRYAGRGLSEVLADLSALGYDAVWTVLHASAFGAPHRRARLWLVAYPHGDSEPDLSIDDEAPVLPEPGAAVRPWPDPPRGMAVDDGVSRWMALSAYGNAVVPQTSEWIGRRIVAAATTQESEHAA